MDVQRLAETIKNLVIGELRNELNDFRSEVSGHLKGYGLAIETLASRMNGIDATVKDIRDELRNLNDRIDETNKRIDETNKRIDELRAELKAEINQNTARIDVVNKRIDAIFVEMLKIRENLEKALQTKALIEDIIVRVERLESKVLSQ